MQIRLTPIAPLLLAAVSVGTCASRPEVTSAERVEAILMLRDSKAKLEAAVSGLTPAQLTFKPTPQRWSITEVVEHLSIVEASVQAILAQLRDAPAGPADRNEKEFDAVILMKVPDRSTKFQAPPEIQPTGKVSGEEALERFDANRQRTIEFVTSSPDLRGHAIPHPALGPLDGYQWALVLATHSTRHTAQIEEVKAASGFPSK